MKFSLLSGDFSLKIMRTVLILPLILMLSCSGETRKNNTDSEAESEIRKTSSKVSVNEKSSPLMEYLMIDSQILRKKKVRIDSRKEILVVLPESYHEEPEKKYPVIYLLCDFGVSVKNFATGKYQGMSLPDSFHLSVRSAGLQEMILVVIDGRIGIFESFYQDSPMFGDWETFIAEELTGIIDSRFRTVQNKDFRGIAGIGMGGFGALSIAFSRPDVFQSVYAMSPWLLKSGSLKKISELSEYSRVRQIQQRLKENPDKSVNDEEWIFQFPVSYAGAFLSGRDNVRILDFQYPFDTGNGGTVNVDQKISRKWEEQGLRNIEDKVGLYQKKGILLKSAAFDYALQDEMQWIPEGCRDFSEYLKDQKIPHTQESYQGFHQNKIAERFSIHALGYFSRIFSR